MKVNTMDPEEAMQVHIKSIHAQTPQLKREGKEKDPYRMFMNHRMSEKEKERPLGD